MTTIDMVVLTGFLGSGKTTLLSEYLSGPTSAATAVIVNEVAELDVDGALISSQSATTSLTLLSNGCVCCSIGSDLTQTIADIISDRFARGVTPLKNIVLETSGLSQPGPILRSLLPLGEFLRVAVLSTFDCARGVSNLEYHEAGAQITGSQRIVLTKQDLVSKEQSDEIKIMLETINPMARIIDEPTMPRRARLAFSPADDTSAADLIQLANSGVDTDDEERLHRGIRCVTCIFTHPVAYDQMLEWLDNVSGLLGNRLLRVKGLVKLQSEIEQVVVQSVGTLFSPITKFSGTSERSFIVIIARDIVWTELKTIEPKLEFRVQSPRGHCQVIGWAE